MSKTYKIKVNQGQGEATFVDIPLAGGLTKPLAVKAVPGGKYQLVDTATGYAPENIRASRSGKNLQVFFEGRGSADLVIEDYYEVTSEGFNGLIGESESGRFYEYIPESAAGHTSVPMLPDGSNQIGMALGGAEINASGAAVGALVAAAVFNPLLLAPLAVLGAVGAAGAAGSAATGGGAAPAVLPVVKSAQLHMDDDTGAKDNVTSDRTPRIVGETQANADVSVELNGKTYTGKADANGLYAVQIPDVDALKDGTYTPKVTATDAANNKSLVLDGTSFKVDTSGDKNEPDADPNTGALLDIVGITEDSGFDKTDFYTQDNQLVFTGTLKNFKANGDWVKLELKDAAGQLVDSAYVKPTANGTAWDWSWDRSKSAKLADGQYALSAVLVDGADNAVGVGNIRISDVQAIIVDTDKDHNFGSVKEIDPNKSSAIDIVAMSLDAGYSATDFVTKDRTHVYTGKLSTFTGNGAMVELTLKDASGKVISTDQVSPKQESGAWTWIWDQTSNALPDGEYTLQANLVDKAGNAMHTDTQVIVVDNSASESGGKTDLNASLKMMPVTFEDDTGISQTDYLTNDQLLKFKGGFDKDFVNNGDRVLVKVFGADGLVISQQYVLPSGKNWVFDNLTKLGADSETGTYTVKSILVDAAGNTLKATDQSFVIDRAVSIVDESGAKKEAGVWTYSTIKFSSDEQGTYKYTGASGVKNYTGGLFDLKDLAGKTFEKGTFSLEFTDWAGNAYTIKNDDVRMDFTSAVMATPDASLPTTWPTPGFNANQLAGSVGKFVFGVNDAKELNMASLYDGIADLGDVAAINHVDLLKGDHVLQLTMGDVLDLGVKNSFSSSAAHKDHLQIRIDGDVADKVILDDLVGTIDHDWNANNSRVTLDGQEYKAYTHDGLGLSLFVQQGIQINLI